MSRTLKYSIICLQLVFCLLSHSALAESCPELTRHWDKEIENDRYIDAVNNLNNVSNGYIEDHYYYSSDKSFKLGLPFKPKSDAFETLVLRENRDKDPGGRVSTSVVFEPSTDTNEYHVVLWQQPNRTNPDTFYFGARKVIENYTNNFGRGIKKREFVLLDENEYFIKGKETFTHVYKMKRKTKPYFMIYTFVRNVRSATMYIVEINSRYCGEATISEILNNKNSPYVALINNFEVLNAAESLK